MYTQRNDDPVAIRSISPEEYHGSQLFLVGYKESFDIAIGGRESFSQSRCILSKIVLEIPIPSMRYFLAYRDTKVESWHARYLARESSKCYRQKKIAILSWLLFHNAIARHHELLIRPAQKGAV